MPDNSSYGPAIEMPPYPVFPTDTEGGDWGSYWEQQRAYEEWLAQQNQQTNQDLAGQFPTFGGGGLGLPLNTDPGVVGDAPWDLTHGNPTTPTEVVNAPVDPNHGVIDPTQTSNGGLFGSGVDFSLMGLGSAAGLLGAVGLGAAGSGIFGGGGGGAPIWNGGQTPPETNPTTIPAIPPVGGSSGQENNPTTVPIIPPVGGNPASQGDAPPTNIPIPPTIPQPVYPGQQEPNQGTTTIPVAPIGQPGAGQLGDATRPTTIPLVPIPFPGGAAPWTGTSPSSNPTTPTSPTPTPTPMPTANPLDRNYYNEGRTALDAHQNLFGDIFGLYNQYAGQYANSDMSRYAGLLPQLGSTNNTLTGIAGQQTQQANSQLRAGNLADAQMYGGQANALRQSLNPELYSSLTSLDQRAAGNSPYEQGLGSMFNAGTSPLGQSLEQSALDQLSLGTSISPEEQRAAQQAARSAWSARGLGDSNGAIGDEVLNQYNLGRQRQQERQQFAQNAFGQQTTDLNRQGTLGLNLNQQGLQGQVAATNARMQTAFDPLGYTNSQTTANQGLNQNLFGQGTGFSSGAYMNQPVYGSSQPYNSYTNDVFGSNFNGATARSIAAGNNAAAMAGAKDAGNGQLTNSFLNTLFNVGSTNGWFG